MVFGYSYNELFILINDNNLDLISKFLKELNITEETVKQTATRYVFISIVISIVILAIIVLLQKIYNNYRDRLNRKIKLEKEEIKLKQLEIEKLQSQINNQQTYINEQNADNDINSN